MQIVINMPDEVYKLCVEDAYFIYNESEIIRKAIKNGTPLPKRHGDLIDKKDLLKNAFIREDEDGDIFVEKYYCIEQKVFDDIPTIVKADKE